jgi:hypothetical protein
MHLLFKVMSVERCTCSVNECLGKQKSRLDECDSMLHNDWLDIPMFVIPLIFCSKPGSVSDKNTRRNIFIFMTLCSFHKGSTAER